MSKQGRIEVILRDKERLLRIRKALADGVRGEAFKARFKYEPYIMRKRAKELHISLDADAEDIICGKCGYEYSVDAGTNMDKRCPMECE